jgi:hypothetical protein
VDGHVEWIERRPAADQVGGLLGEHDLERVEIAKSNSQLARKYVIRLSLPLCKRNHSGKLGLVGIVYVYYYL